MDPITLRLHSETIEQVDGEAEERGQQRAVYLRELIETRNEPPEVLDEYEAKVSEYEEVLAEYEDRIEELEQEVERQQRERRQILEQREEHDELVRVVQEEQSLAEQRAKAGVGTRLKWWLVGMEDE